MKKLLTVFSLLLTVLFSGGCVHTGPAGMFYLNDRLKAADRRFALDMTTAVFSGDERRFFWSFGSDRDLALKIRLNPHGDIVSAVLTLRPSEEGAALTEFIAVAEVLIPFVLPGEDPQKVAEALTLYDTEKRFGDELLFYGAEKAKAALLGFSDGVSLALMQVPEAEKSPPEVPAG